MQDGVEMVLEIDSLAQAIRTDQYAGTARIAGKLENAFFTFGWRQ